MTSLSSWRFTFVCFCVLSTLLKSRYTSKDMLLYLRLTDFKTWWKNRYGLAGGAESYACFRLLRSRGQKSNGGHLATGCILVDSTASSELTGASVVPKGERGWGINFKLVYQFWYLPSFPLAVNVRCLFVPVHLISKNCNAVQLNNWETRWE